MEEGIVEIDMLQLRGEIGQSGSGGFGTPCSEERCHLSSCRLSGRARLPLTLPPPPPPSPPPPASSYSSSSSEPPISEFRLTDENERCGGVEESSLPGAGDVVILWGWGEVNSCLGTCPNSPICNSSAYLPKQKGPIPFNCKLHNANFDKS